MISKTMFHRANPRRRLLGLAIGVFSITAAVGCTGIDGLDQAAAEAIVQNVDSLSGEVTVQFKDDTTSTFNLADVDVEALGQLIGDASLEAGDEVEIELDASDRVKSVAPQVSNFEAVVVEVDTTANTVTLESLNGVQIVLTLTVDTRIQLDDDKRGTIDDLVPGMQLKVKYDTDTNQALKIKQHDHDDDDEHETNGTITAIDTDGHTIAVESENGITQIYTVVPETEIKIDGHAPFSELEVGMTVELEFDSTFELTEIKVKQNDHDDEDEGELKGTVTAIDADGGTIAVADADGVETTYSVNSETENEVGDDTEIGDILVGMQVEIEFDSETLVLSEIEVETPDDQDDEEEDHDEDDD